jgi:hypothetical protein
MMKALIEAARGADHACRAMPSTWTNMLVVAIASRALFDLHESDRVFREEGLDAYRAHQIEREDEPLAPGTACSVCMFGMAIALPGGTAQAPTAGLAVIASVAPFRCLGSVVELFVDLAKPQRRHPVLLPVGTRAFPIRRSASPKVHRSAPGKLVSSKVRSS